MIVAAPSQAADACQKPRLQANLLRKMHAHRQDKQLMSYPLELSADLLMVGVLAYIQRSPCMVCNKGDTVPLSCLS